MKSEFSNWFVSQHKSRTESGWDGLSDQRLREIAEEGLMAGRLLACRELWDEKRQSALYAWTAARGATEAPGTLPAKKPPRLEWVPASNDWREPTTYLERFAHAMQLMCNGNRPDDEILLEWLHPELDAAELQEFAIAHGPAWAQGIVVIDAARLLADTPTEGVDHGKLGPPG